MVPAPSGTGEKVPTPGDVTIKLPVNPAESPLDVGFSVKVFPADMVTV
jgi:hypothetical protein